MVVRGVAGQTAKLVLVLSPGLTNLPLQAFAKNQIWLELVQLAAELLAWTQLLAWHDQPARTWEPKRLRLRLLAVEALDLLAQLGVGAAGEAQELHVGDRNPVDLAHASLDHRHGELLAGQGQLALVVLRWPSVRPNRNCYSSSFLTPPLSH